MLFQIPKVDHFQVEKNDFRTDELNHDENLLQVVHQKSNVVIDLGWYGDSVNGSYKIYVIKNNNWDSPVKQIVSKDLTEISAQLKQLLEEIADS